jgi:hypothetical protein
MAIGQLSKDTWQADWEETTWDNAGVGTAGALWHGNFRIVLRQPTSDDQLTAAPLGLFIDEFHPIVVPRYAGIAADRRHSNRRVDVDISLLVGGRGRVRSADGISIGKDDLPDQRIEVHSAARRYDQAVSGGNDATSAAFT